MQKRRMIAGAMPCLLAIALGACAPGNADMDDAGAPQPGAAGDTDADGTRGAAADAGAAAASGRANVLTPQEIADGWQLLFDGTTTERWRGYNQEDMPEGWQAVDGSLVRVAQAGDIITSDQFANFELALDWMVNEAGNSGIFYRAIESEDPIYYSAPEMQVLDDAGHADGGSQLTAAGSNYALHPVAEGVVRPAGEWNSARLVVNGDHVEHWLNGRKVVEYELGSEDWKQRVANSKFAEWPAYGTADRGHIGLQDHGDWVAFRNIRIRVLP
ncbi:MAG TPA: DUF1080 domain-containing protein [Longimicrobiales bacterium]|nr:DUF1080 domain-containing protein [Longimicrobiales bacterium]